MTAMVTSSVAGGRFSPAGGDGGLWSSSVKTGRMKVREERSLSLDVWIWVEIVSKDSGGFDGVRRSLDGWKAAGDWLRADEGRVLRRCNKATIFNELGTRLGTVVALLLKRTNFDARLRFRVLR